MFIPNLKCEVRRVAGRDIYGKLTYGPRRIVPCGVIRLEEMSESTTVRADSSASRGNAMEEKILSRMMFPAKHKLGQGDQVKVEAFTMVVQSVWPRFAVSGRLDHWQVDLLILQE